MDLPDDPNYPGHILMARTLPFSPLTFLMGMMTQPQITASSLGTLR